MDWLNSDDIQDKLMDKAKNLVTNKVKDELYELCGDWCPKSATTLTTSIAFIAISYSLI